MTFTCDITVKVGTIIFVNLVRAPHPGNILLNMDMGNTSTMVNFVQWPDRLIKQFDIYTLQRQKATNETVSLNFIIPARNKYMFWASVSAYPIKEIECSHTNSSPMSYPLCPSAPDPPSTETDEDKDPASTETDGDNGDTQDRENKKESTIDNKEFILIICVSIFVATALIATVVAAICICRKSGNKAPLRPNLTEPPSVATLQRMEQTSDIGLMDTNTEETRPTGEVSQTTGHDNKANVADTDSDSEEIYQNIIVMREMEMINSEKAKSTQQENNVLKYHGHRDNTEFHFRNEEDESFPDLNDITHKQEGVYMNNDNNMNNDFNMNDDIYMNAGLIDDEPHAYKVERDEMSPSMENIFVNTTDELKLKLQARRMISEKE
ncbi:unnamed protein product [Owenia fusiformis]|uniref:Uncharacterized protein n=1 Tax=Owenia fusiformis TaxID=6347 RepID=A0A8S4Q9Q1_OWEFU|nr:unnamed protein product [Owenia fusiformis]